MATVGRSPADALAQASGWGALAIYGNGMRHPGNPFFSFHACSVFSAAYALLPPYGIPSASVPPDIDWTLWDGVSDLITFLNSVDTLGGWMFCTGNPTSNGYAQRVANPEEGVTGWWLCHVAGWMLPLVSGQAFGGNQALLRHLPPIWPGADFVTMGSITSLGLHWSIEEPLNGVVCSISTAAIGKGRYDWDEYTQYPRAGYVTFLNDGGTFETPQPLSMEAQVITPKVCREATKVIGRCAPGVSGFAQAWAFCAP